MLKKNKKVNLQPVPFEDMVKVVELNNRIENESLQQSSKTAVVRSANENLMRLTEAVQREYQYNLGLAKNLVMRLFAVGAILNSSTHEEWGTKNGSEPQVDDIHPAIFLVAAKMSLKQTKGVFNKRKFVASVNSAIALFDGQGNLLVPEETVRI